MARRCVVGGTDAARRQITSKARDRSRPRPDRQLVSRALELELDSSWRNFQRNTLSFPRVVLRCCKLQRANKPQSGCRALSCVCSPFVNARKDLRERSSLQLVQLCFRLGVTARISKATPQCSPLWSVETSTLRWISTPILHRSEPFAFSTRP